MSCCPWSERVHLPVQKPQVRPIPGPPPAVAPWGSLAGGLQNMVTEDLVKEGDATMVEINPRIGF